MSIKIVLFLKLFPPVEILSLGDMLTLIFRGVYLFNNLEERGYLSWSLILIVFVLIGLLAVGLCYLTIKTIRMRKNITAMGTVLDQEGEVTEIIDDYGKKGWVFIYGENWKFRSEKNLKVGDLVKVIKYRKMDLIVEKISES